MSVTICDCQGPDTFDPPGLTHNSMCASMGYRPKRSWHIGIEFKLADAWIGVFWRTDVTPMGERTRWWVCLVPMLPIVVERTRHRIPRTLREGRPGAIHGPRRKLNVQ